MNRCVILLAACALAGCAKVFDETRGISNVCPVHHVMMDRKKVPVVDGRIFVRETLVGTRLAGSVSAYSQLKKEQFPFADSKVGISDEERDAPAEAWLYVCRSCVAARAKWVSAKMANKAPEPTPGSVTLRAPSR